MEMVGYPVIFLYLLLVVGIPLALIRPYNAFLLVVFLVSAAESLRFTHTRTALLGPYFNMFDACLLIALLSMLPGLFFRGSRLQVPPVITWVIGVLLIGFFQSYINLGLTYETVRILRWSASLPVYFIISATLVDKRYKVKEFLLAVFIGSIFSAVEHIVFVQSRLVEALAQDNITFIRTISFRSPGLWLLLAGIIWVPRISYLKRPLMLLVGVLFGLSVLLNQTRSIWISSVLALPVIMVLYRIQGIMFKALVVPIIIFLLFGGMYFFLQYITPEISSGDIIRERANTLLDDAEREKSTEGRQNALTMELKYWSEGSLILGRGLFYYQNIYLIEKVAWGHLGHVTTLAQLGLLGLFVLSVYFPKKVVDAGLVLWKAADGEVRFLGLFAGLTMVWCIICFFLSDSFLSQLPTRGLIFGAAFRQAQLLLEQNKGRLS